MPSSRITLTGADSAHYQNAVTMISRLVPFPDGITRLLRLTKWQWEVFDRWQWENGWHPTRIPEGALEIATIIGAEFDSRDYEQDVRDSLVSILQACMADCAAIPLEAANGNGRQF